MKVPLLSVVAKIATKVDSGSTARHVSGYVFETIPAHPLLTSAA